MDASGYVTLSRQSGLLNQMQSIANNIANSATIGFRREGLVFSEYIQSTGEGPSLSMGYGNARVVDLLQAGLTETGGSFDLAIEGDGFFMIDTPQGQQLTRSGAFMPGSFAVNGNSSRAVEPAALPRCPRCNRPVDARQPGGPRAH